MTFVVTYMLIKLLSFKDNNFHIIEGYNKIVIVLIYNKYCYYLGI